MEVQLNSLNKESKKIGLIHKGKTKFMTNFQTNESIVVENDELEKSGQLQVPGPASEDGR